MFGFTINVHHHFEDKSPLTEAINLLRALQAQIKLQGDRIMSKISEFADKVEAHNTKLGAAVDGLVADVDMLKKQVADLQNSPDRVTPADQDRLDTIESTLGAAADKLAALDALTEQAPPPPEPEPPA